MVALERDVNSGKTISRKQSLGVAVSSAVVAIAVFLVTFIVAYVLDPEQNNQFLLFWSSAFFVFGAVMGIQQEATRAVGDTLLSSWPGDKANTFPLAVAGTWGILIAIGLIITSFLWGPAVLGVGFFSSVFAIAIGVVFYACHVCFVGISAGRRNWSVFAALGATEGILRLILTILVALFAASLWGFQIAAVAPVFTWIIFILLSHKTRSLLSTRVSASFGHLIKSMGLSILTSAAYALMVTGFPMLLQVTSGKNLTSDEIFLLTATILGVNITRAPIMIPLQTFQGVAISAFLKQRHRPIAALAKPTLILLGVGIIGAIAAYLIGPFLFDLFYMKYAGALSPFVLAALTFASAFMALVVLSGTASLAMNLHKLYLLGWMFTVLVAVVCLYLPIGVDLRAIVALILGPCCGFCCHLIGLVKHTNRP